MSYFAVIREADPHARQSPGSICLLAVRPAASPHGRCVRRSRLDCAAQAA